MNYDPSTTWQSIGESTKKHIILHVKADDLPHLKVDAELKSIFDLENFYGVKLPQTPVDTPNIFNDFKGFRAFFNPNVDDGQHKYFALAYAFLESLLLKSTLKFILKQFLYSLETNEEIRNKRHTDFERPFRYFEGEFHGDLSLKENLLNNLNKLLTWRNNNDSKKFYNLYNSVVTQQISKEALVRLFKSAILNYYDFKDQETYEEVQDILKEESRIGIEEEFSNVLAEIIQTEIIIWKCKNGTPYIATKAESANGQSQPPIILLELPNTNTICILYPKHIDKEIAGSAFILNPPNINITERSPSLVEMEKNINQRENDLHKCLIMTQRAIVVTYEAMNGIRDQRKIDLYKEFLLKVRELLSDMTNSHQQLPPSKTLSLLRNSLSKIKSGEDLLAQYEQDLLSSMSMPHAQRPLSPPITQQKPYVGGSPSNIYRTGEMRADTTMNQRPTQNYPMKQVNYPPRPTNNNLFHMGANSNLRDNVIVPHTSVIGDPMAGRGGMRGVKHRPQAPPSYYERPRDTETNAKSNTTTYEEATKAFSQITVPAQATIHERTLPPQPAPPTTINYSPITNESPAKPDPFVLFRTPAATNPMGSIHNTGIQQKTKCDRCNRYSDCDKGFQFCAHRFCEACYQQFNHECILCKNRQK